VYRVSAWILGITVVAVAIVCVRLNLRASHKQGNGRAILIERQWRK